tara:strand:+ start:833 stop:1981 length:1149 start_codon:yes stop_codon:yes gene_type:complete
VSDWEQPAENTLDSLAHGITNCDGIELDLRMTADGELVIHHDAKVSVKNDLIANRNPYVESWDLAELEEFGFCSLRGLLEDKRVLDQWQYNGKMVCLELKRPHPNSPLGGGYFNTNGITKILSQMIEKSSSLLDEYEIPKSNTVFYAFHNGMHKSVKDSKCQYHWAELLPVVPRFGPGKMKRMMAYPQYLVTPFARLINKHKSRGAAMVPCAIEYFQPFYNRLLIGRSVGLSGRRLEYFKKCQTGMPVYVWPAKEKYEFRLLNSGITGLTDNLDPNFTWYDDGHPRWRFPATQPLDNEQLNQMANIEYENHNDLLKEFSLNVPTWSEADHSRRNEITKMWYQKWNWSQPTSTSQTSDSAPPWQAVRLIGHRGSGKTPRPVIK